MSVALVCHSADIGWQGVGEAGGDPVTLVECITASVEEVVRDVADVGEELDGVFLVWGEAEGGR